MLTVSRDAQLTMRCWTSQWPLWRCRDVIMNGQPNLTLVRQCSQPTSQHQGKILPSNVVKNRFYSVLKFSEGVFYTEWFLIGVGQMENFYFAEQFAFFIYFICARIGYSERKDTCPTFIHIIMITPLLLHVTIGWTVWSLSPELKTSRISYRKSNIFIDFINFYNNFLFRFEIVHFF